MIAPEWGPILAYGVAVLALSMAIRTHIDLKYLYRRIDHIAIGPRGLPGPPGPTGICKCDIQSQQKATK